MTHVMIDIETLGTTQEAVILSIGATEFTLTKGIKTEIPVKNFHRLIDLGSQPKRKMDASTVIWWMQQDEEARSSVTAGDRVGLMNALEGLTEFLFQFDPRTLVVWANGVTFDISILEHAYKQHGLLLPWHYRRVACMRTLKNLLLYDIEVEQVGVGHNALNDAQYQANWVAAACRSISGELLYGT